MALLDFIKNRQASEKTPAAGTPQQQRSDSTKPQTAKEMYTREAANEKTSRNPVERMPEDQRAKAQEIGARLDNATNHLNQNAQTPSPAPADSASSPEASRQNMTNQDKAAPDLSPTSMQAGSTGHEAHSPAHSNDAPADSRQNDIQSPSQTPSPSRGRGGWER